MKITRLSIAKAVETVLSDFGVRQATVYLSSDTVVKATRHGKPHRGRRTTQLFLTMGSPNYEERAFIAACRKAGEPLPVRKVQLVRYHGK